MYNESFSPILVSIFGLSIFEFMNRRNIHNAKGVVLI